MSESDYDEATREDWYRLWAESRQVALERVSAERTARKWRR